MKKLFLICSFVLSLAVQGQVLVSGKVLSQDDGLGLPGATVQIKGTSLGKTTDNQGVYSIEVSNPNAVLVFSFVGMITQQVPIEGRKVVNVTLVTDASQLEEMVVIGYGVQKKSLVTGAISSISAKDIERPGIMRADQALQGKTAGVSVVTNSGQPGEGITIRIRGTGTNGNSAPLFIVDGQAMGDIEFLNPSDIESMEVLKDAASSAIYGARGANGVILISTKKGKAGEVSSINYQAYFGWQNIRRKLDLLDAQSYMLIQNEAAFNGGQSLPFTDADRAKFGKGTDWQKEVINENAPIVNHQLSFSGSAGNSTYFLSGSYFTQDGVVAKGKSNYERLTFRESTDHTYFDGIFKVGQSIIFSDVQKQGIDANNIWGGPLLGAINIDPLTPVKNENGTWGESKYASQEIVNPVARLSTINSKYKYTRIFASAYFELSYFNFKLKSSVSSEFNWDDSWGYNPIYRLNSSVKNDVTGTNRSKSQSTVTTYENVLSYANTFGKHDVSALIGNTLVIGNGNNVGASKQGLLIEDPRYGFLDLAKIEESAKAWGGAWNSALVSYFGRVNYSYDGRYIFSATVRADGSSRFGKNNRFGYFPSVSAGWNISNEDFFKSVEGINSLKLRASWGQNGNESIGDWQYLATIATGARGYTFNGVIVPGASPGKISNPDLKWETSEQINIGLDVNFLKKYNLSLDYYIKNTKDLLIVVPIPGYVGAPPAASNAGSVKNSGLELLFGYHDQKGDFSWGVDLNMSYNKNKVIKVGNETGWVGGASVGTSMSNVTRMEEGLPISYFWGYQTDGLFQNMRDVQAYADKDGKPIQPNARPGDIRFKDLNNDGKLDDSDRSMIGNPNPDVIGGLTLSFSWKGFDVNAFFQGVYGNEIFNATRRWDLPMSNYQQSVLERWTGEGTSNSFPRVTTTDSNKNFSTVSDFFLEDGSYLRLKNFTVGYSFTNLKKIYIQKLRIYATASNLFCLTKYSGFDPEVGSGWVLGNGIDYGNYPQPRTYNLGINIVL